MRARPVRTNSASCPNVISTRGGTHPPSKGIVWLLALAAGLAPGLAKGTVAYMVTVGDPAPYGTVSPSPGVHTYLDFEVVSIQASPALGRQFAYWTSSGGVIVANRYSNSTTMTFTGNGTLSVALAPVWYVTLVVIAPTNGTVSPPPGSHTYADQWEGGIYRIPTLVIEATPDPDYQFKRWTLIGPATIDQPHSTRATLVLADINGATVDLLAEFEPLSAANAVIVPNVVGQTQSQASAALTAAGLVVGTITRRLSETVPAGQVISQDYAAGARVARGSTVNLTVSIGPFGTPLAWWMLDETKGVIAADSAGGYFGVLHGSPTWLPTGGKIGGALGFDGIGDYVSLPIDLVIGGLTKSTFMGWVNWTGRGGSGQHIFDFGSETANSMFLTPNEDVNGRLRFAISVTGSNDQDQTTAASGLPTGWHHVAVTIDPNNHTHLLYLDGQVVGRNSQAHYTPGMLNTTPYNLLGRSQASTDAYYKGALDDFRIYDVVLSDKQIAAVMTGKD